MNYSEKVLLFNAILYTCTLIIYYKKYKLSIGVFIWILYVLSAWSSFFFIQQPLYRFSVHVSDQTLWPCIYLYLVFTISILPLMRINKINKIEYNNEILLEIIFLICSIIQVIFIIVDFPSCIRVIRSGTTELTALRSTVYSNSSSVSMLSKNPILNRLMNLFSGMRVLATGLSVIAFFTYKRHRPLVNLFFLSTLFNNIRIIIVQVGRGEMVFLFLLYGCSLYLIRDWISEKVKKKLITIAIPVILLGVAFFWAITISRFGDRAMFFMFKYLGEPINNFDGLLFYKIQGHTNGLAYFGNLFGKTLYTADDKWTFILSKTGVRGDIFYTWVGGIIIEFGKWAPFIVAGIFSIFVYRLSKIKKYFEGDLIALIFFINFYIRGIFLFPTQNIEGTLMILYSIILYFAFRIKKKNGHVVFVLPKNKKREKYLNLGE